MYFPVIWLMCELHIVIHLQIQVRVDMQDTCVIHIESHSVIHMQIQVRVDMQAWRPILVPRMLLDAITIVSALIMVQCASSAHTTRTFNLLLSLMSNGP